MGLRYSFAAHNSICAAWVEARRSRPEPRTLPERCATRAKPHLRPFNLKVGSIEHQDAQAGLVPSFVPSAPFETHASCSDTGFGEGRCMLINVYVFIFLMGESIAPCAWGGGGARRESRRKSERADLNSQRERKQSARSV